MAKTGVFLVTDNQHLDSGEDKEDFWAAVEQYCDQGRPPGRVNPSVPSSETPSVGVTAVLVGSPIRRDRQGSGTQAGQRRAV